MPRFSAPDATALGRSPRASPTIRSACPGRACPCKGPVRGRRTPAGPHRERPRRIGTAAPPCRGSEARERSRSTGGVITPRSSAIRGSLPSSARAASSGAPSGPRRQRPARASRASCGDRPVGDQAAEVVQAHDVEQLDRASHPLDPPAVALTLHRRPAVDRVAPALPLGGIGVRRSPRHETRFEQAGMAPVIDAPGRDVERHVSDQPHATLTCIGAQGQPLALEADLIEHRLPVRRRPAPNRRSSRTGARGTAPPPCSRRPRRGAPAALASTQRPSWTYRASASGPAGRGEASATTTVRPSSASRRTRRPPAPSRPDGREVMCSCTPLERGIFKGVGNCLASWDWTAGRNGKRTSHGLAYPEAHPVNHGSRRGRAARAPPRTLPSAVQIEELFPQLDGGRYRVKRCPGDFVRVSATIFRDGHDSLQARRQVQGARRDPHWQEAPMARVDAHLDGDRWSGRVHGRGDRALELADRGLDGSLRQLAGGARRKLAGGQTDLDSELAEGAELLEQARGRAKGVERKRIGRALELLGDPSAEPDARRGAPLRSTPRCSRHASAGPTARVGRAARSSRSTSSASGPDSVPGMSCSPAPGEASTACANGSASYPSSASTSSICLRSTRSAFFAARDPKRQPEGGTRRSREPLGDRRADRRAHRDPSRARAPSRSSSVWSTSAREHGMEIALDFAAAVLGRPSLAATSTPSGSAIAPTGRSSTPRTRPKRYMDIYNFDFDCEQLALAVGGAARRDALLGGARRARLPRRQPAHQAAGLLGVADRVGAERWRRRRSSCRRHSRARR